MSRRASAQLITCIPVFMIFLDATVVNVAFPSIQAAFPDTSLAGLSWVLSAYSICFASLLVPFGRLADLIPARRVFLAGISVFLIASALCAVAPSVWVLIAARALQGIGGAAVAPSAQALLMAAVPKERRTAAMSLMVALAGVATAAGPPLGALLVQAGGWRLVFLVNVPIGLVAILCYRLLPQPEGAGRTLPDLLGAAAAVIAIGALALGLVQGSWWGWSDPRIIGAFVLSAVVLAVVLWRCRRHPVPVVPLLMFRVRSFSAGNAGTLLIGLAFYSLLLANSLFLAQVWDYSVLRTGLALMPTPVVTAIVALPASKFAARFGPRLPLAAGAVTIAVGAVWLSTRVGTQPDFLGDWLPGAILLGAGLGLAYPLFAGVTVADLSAGELGVGSGVSSMTRQLGAVLGVTILIAVIGNPAPAQAVTAFRHGWWVAVVASILALVPAFLAGRAADATAPVSAEAVAAR